MPYNAPGSTTMFYKFLDEERKWTKWTKIRVILKDKPLKAYDFYINLICKLNMVSIFKLQTLTCSKNKITLFFLVNKLHFVFERELLLKLKATRQFRGLFILNFLGHFLTDNILVTKEKWSTDFYNSLNFFSTSYNLSVLNYALLGQNQAKHP